MAIKFGTDGWRAVISDEFTFANVKFVAQAISSYIIGKGIKNKGLIVGYDTRFLSENYAEEVVKVLSLNGIPSFLADRDTPTPAIAFSVKDKNAAGAIMLTASHNPPQYSGIKFIPEYAGPAFQNITDEIMKQLNVVKMAESRNQTKIQRFNPQNRYIKHIEELIDLDSIGKSKLKIAYDPLWGTGRDYLDKILLNHGVNVSIIHEHRDVLFGGITPEPVDEHLGALKALVIKEKCAIGLSTDPDADRFGIIDETGNYVSANKILATLFAYLIDERAESGCVIKSIATTRMLDAIANAHGLKVFETPVGFKHIAEVMLREQTIMAGEESGGFTMGDHVPEKDGILANLLVSEMIARLKKPLSAIIKDASKKYGSFYDKRINLKLTNFAKATLMESLGSEPPARAAGKKLSRVIKSDGVKMVFEDGSWILARPSGTEPIVRTYYESDSEEKLKEMVLNFESYISSVIGI